MLDYFRSNDFIDLTASLFLTNYIKVFFCNITSFYHLY